MENQEIKRGPQGNGKKVVGTAILVIGLALLVKQLGFIEAPRWLFSWPMILIVIGIASGIKHNFRNATWFILLLIGGVFLLQEISSEFSVAHLTWPIILIGVGLLFIFGKGFKGSGDFRGRRKWRRANYDSYYQTSNSCTTDEPKKDEPVAEEQNRQATGDEIIDSVSIFGGTKRNIFSKNFKGGEIVNIMGGAEINLTHADINGVVELEVVQIFGGTKIIIPPTWDVNSEMAAIFGGIDDKRSMAQVLPNRSKVLIIKGTSVFGGIEIRNF